MQQLTFEASPPLARNTDPRESHVAAVKVKRSRKEIVAAIRDVSRCAGEPLTQFEIARRVRAAHPEKRWAEVTVRAACRAAGLEHVDSQGVSDLGAACGRYMLLEDA